MDKTLNFLSDERPIHDYWNEAIVSFTGKNELSSRLPSKEGLLSSVTGHFVENKWNAGLSVNINASKVIDANNNQQLLSVELSHCAELFMNGFSLCFGDMSEKIEPLIDLKEEAAKIFGQPELIFITAYLSPPKAIGPLHYDRQHNFFIQREGAKKWSVSSTAAVENPFENLVYSNLDQGFFENMRAAGYVIRTPKECGRNEIILNEGDILYIPPGFYHSPETLENPSLHYTLTIEPANFWNDNNKHLFSLMLGATDLFNRDYRFMSAHEKRLLFDQCNILTKKHRL